MSTVLEQRGLPEARARWMPWLVLGVALAALYVPTYVSLARGLWRDDVYAHGPIILAVFAWLAWRERFALAEPSPGAPVAGCALLAAGLLLDLAGRTFSLALLEVASHLPVLAGLVLMLRGPAALRRLGFAILFLFFLVPLPGFVLDWATTPLKTVVSAAVAGVLQLAGYAVERTGVMLELGGHSMLVADACSGLNSIFSLFALGVLYAHLTPPRTGTRMLLLAASIVPIAIVANIVRVALLVLITYHAGEDAAQGFLHGFAGIVVFVVALGLLITADAVIKQNQGQIPRSAEENVRDGSDRSLLRNEGSVPGLAYLAAIAVAAVAVAAPVLKPVPSGEAIDLERAIPATFGEWRIDPAVVPLAPSPDVKANLDRIYQQVVSRTYVNAAGERIMLTVAHGGDQSDALKAHRQEKCYEAQGFAIAGIEHGTLSAASRTIPVTRLLAVRGERVEPVTYWFTMGDRVVLGRGERLRAQVAAGLAGRIPDGMLVRVSSLSDDPADAFAAQQDFTSAIFAHIAPAEAARFLGGREG